MITNISNSTPTPICSRRLRNKTPPHQRAEEVVYYSSIDELIKLISDHSQSKSNTTLKQLLKSMTPIKSNGTVYYWDSWIKVKTTTSKVLMRLSVENRSYDSQCFIESEQPLKLKNKMNYYFICANYENNNDRLYFQIRIDKKNQFGEILHIEKGDNISGTEVKNVCLKLLNCLQTKTIIINDDSKVGDDHCPLYLRVFEPIVNPEAHTWYTKDGFKLLECGEFKNASNSFTHEQKLSVYQQSVQKIRQTTLNELSSSLFTKALSWWHLLRPEDNIIELSSYTIHDLGKNIYLCMRAYPQLSVLKEIFKEFYLLFLTPNKEQKPYYQTSLKIIKNYQFWIKSY